CIHINLISPCVSYIYSYFIFTCFFLHSFFTTYLSSFSLHDALPISLIIVTIKSWALFVSYIKYFAYFGATYYDKYGKITLRVNRKEVNQLWLVNEYSS